MTGNDFLIALIAYLGIGCIVVAIQLENAPSYDEENGKFIYKEWYTIFGIKIKRNKK